MQSHLAKDGYRVLAFASGEYKEYQKKEMYENEDIPALTLLRTCRLY
jgi:magnesium-transporting ATPase (P-type)